MKKTSLLIVALAASCLSGFAQATDNIPNDAGPANVTEASISEAPVPVTPEAAVAEPASPDASAEIPAAAPVEGIETPVPVVVDGAAEVVVPPAATPDTTAPDAAVVTENTSPAVADEATLAAPVEGSTEIVPLIQIDDAPLPDAIKTLARQAGINFQFDPQVLNPAPDAQGRIPAQPMVSLRWENVTAMEALMALLENYNLQIKKDSKTRIARITKKDAAALEPLVTHVFQLDYANPTNMVMILTNTISNRGRVVADLRTSQLVVSATEKELDAVEALIKELDTQTKQILIEARFLEINKNPRSSKGLDWTDTLSQQNITFGNGLSSVSSGTNGTSLISNFLPGDPTVSPGITANTADGFNPKTFFLNADGVKVALSFLNSDADLESIATPRAVTLENVPTELNVVRNIPVFEEEQGTSIGGSQAPATVKPNYLLAGPNNTILNEVGIKLIVTPRIFGSSNVFLDLKPEISEKEVEPETTTLGGRVSSAPIFSRRKLQTQAMIPSGYTLVLGGLRQDFSSKTHTKVPILGDIPGIGLAFRSHTKARDERDLVIFVTPTIISSGDFQKNENSNGFLKREMEEKQIEEWDAWDSAKPVDWTKPGEPGKSTKNSAIW